MRSKPKIKKHGKVKKILKPPFGPEKAEIEIAEADPLYQEIRIENTLEDDTGQKKLTPGAEVDVTIEADPAHTAPKARKEDEDAELTPKT
jgi:hypothetical protein